MCYVSNTIRDCGDSGREDLKRILEEHSTEGVPAHSNFLVTKTDDKGNESYKRLLRVNQDKSITGSFGEEPLLE
jgi:hypothetical protein